MVNITGSNISNIAINGNATNEGTQTNTMREVDVSVRVQAIQNVLDNLKAIPADTDGYEEVVAIGNEAQASPSPSMIRKFVDALGRFRDGLDHLAGSSKSAVTIAEGMKQLSEFM